MRVITRGLWAALCAIVLVSCGGGGGGGGGDDGPPVGPPVFLPQTVTFANAGPVTRPLGDATYTNVATGGPGSGAITYTSSATSVATVNGLGVVSFVSAGLTTITATKAGDSQYSPATVSYSLNILPPPAPQAQTIAFDNPGPITRALTDVSYLNAASGGAGSGAITYQSSNSSVATVNASGLVTFVAGGTTSITANKAADASHLAATASYSLTITAPVAQQPQTITFATAGPVSRPLTDGSYTNVVSSGNGTGAISYQSSNTAVATVSQGGVVTLLAAGSTTITATKAADSGYLATAASYSLTVTTPAPQPQVIAFGTPGPVTISLDDGNFLNSASGGSGTGAISYLSSNTTIAMVDANTGLVSPAAPGTVTITASKAADANYLAATASYQMTVTPHAGAAVPFSGWMSATDLQFAFQVGPGLGPVIELLRSPQLSCNAAAFNTCAGGVTSIASATTTDTVAFLNREVNWWLRDGARVSPPLRINPTRFEPRHSGGAVSWRGKLWVIGGRPIPLFGGGTSSEVWNSDDGVHWVRVTADGGFPARLGAGFAVFNDRVWMLGGTQQTGLGGFNYTNDVWSSADGITWRQEAAAAPWTPRSGLSALVFNNRLWVVGGSPYPLGTLEGGDDAWSSADGVSWVEETHDAPFFKGAVATLLNGRIYTAGGRENGAYGDDVHSSADGRTWRLETASAPFGIRNAPVFAAQGGKLLLAGGLTVPGENVRSNDVWSSSDGATWVRETAQAPFSPRANAAFTLHRGALWIMGGYIGDFDSRLGGSRLFAADDVWSTRNGVDWTEHSPQANGIWQGLHNTVVQGGRIWLLGGWDNQARNDTWWSSDGATWNRQPAGTSYPARSGPAVTTLNGEFWIAGGSVTTFSGTTEYDDIWKSADGINWTRTASAPAFLPRSGYEMVGFNNQLYVMGGWAPNEGPVGDMSTEVWTSSNGTDWTQLPQVAPFEKSTGTKVLVFNGRIWRIGNIWLSNPLSDVWSSADGANWRQESNTPLRGWRMFAAAVHNGRLWIAGGGRSTSGPNPELNARIYSSPDGVTWTEVTGGPRFSPRADASMFSFDNKLWVMGGTDLSRLRNDIWVSADDGVTWRMRYSGVLSHP